MASTNLSTSPSQIPTNTTSSESVGAAAQKVDEKYYHGHTTSNTLGETNVSSSVSSSSALESSQNQLLASETGIEQGHNSMASSNLGTDPAANGVAVDSSSPAVSPGQNGERSTNGGPETQNPPVQVMERSDDPTPAASASMYKIPSHVFDRTSTTTPVEWSTCSNESLFSIHVGTMSFTKEVPWFKSGDLDKYGDMSMLGPPNSLQCTNQPPAPAGNKFNDMSQRTAEQVQGSGVTEAKAAETMREVIMENTERIREDELSTLHATSQYNVLSNPSNQSGYSDGSTKSFAFQPLTGEGGQSKTGSSRHSLSIKKIPEKEKHLSEPPQISKETTKAAAAAEADEMAKSAAALEMPKPAPTTTTNNKWLSCFACCPFCH